MALRDGPPKGGDIDDIPAYGPIDRVISRVFVFFTVKHRLLTSLAAVLGYAALVLLADRSFRVSSNFFVVLPVLTVAMSYGFPGGLVAGLLGLPANLALFALTGNPEFAPASLPLAEAAGLVLGGALGYLSDYFRKLQAEIARRKATEAKLVTALEEKGVLLAEFHHRIRNNLNLVKSLIQLQGGRSADPAFKAACDKLARRIVAIARVHDRLYEEESLVAIEPRSYLRDLLENIFAGAAPETGAAWDLEASGGPLTVVQAGPLGLIINETVTNALRHAPLPGRTLRIRVSFAEAGDRRVLEVRDDGIGWDGRAPQTPAGAAPANVAAGTGPEARKEALGGLGSRIIKAACDQLEGDYSFRVEGGTVFSLSFPSARVEDGKVPATCP